MGPSEQLAWWLHPGLHEPPDYTSNHYRDPHEQELAMQPPEQQRLHTAFSDVFEAWKQVGMEGVIVIRVDEEHPQ